MSPIHIHPVIRVDGRKRFSSEESQQDRAILLASRTSHIMIELFTDAKMKITTAKTSKETNLFSQPFPSAYDLARIQVFQLNC